MERKEIAVTLHHNNFSCTQSLVAAYANVLGYDPLLSYKMAEGLGLGMGNMGFCGLIPAMGMIVGAKLSDGDMDNPKTKRRCYNIMTLIQGEFNERVGSMNCSEIKNNAADGKGMNCDEILKMACEILDRHLLGLYDRSEIRIIDNRAKKAAALAAQAAKEDEEEK